MAQAIEKSTPHGARFPSQIATPGLKCKMDRDLEKQFKRLGTAVEKETDEDHESYPAEWIKRPWGRGRLDHGYRVHYVQETSLFRKVAETTSGHVYDIQLDLDFVPIGDGESFTAELDNTAETALRQLLLESSKPGDIHCFDIFNKQDPLAKVEDTVGFMKLEPRKLAVSRDRMHLDPDSTVDVVDLVAGVVMLDNKVFLGHVKKDALDASTNGSTLHWCSLFWRK